MALPFEYDFNNNVIQLAYTPTVVLWHLSELHRLYDLDETPCSRRHRALGVVSPPPMSQAVKVTTRQVTAAK